MRMMTRRGFFGTLASLSALGLGACGQQQMQSQQASSDSNGQGLSGASPYSTETTVGEVRGDAVFGDWGRLIFPVDRDIPDDATLADVGDYLVWYHNISADRTVEICNYLHDCAAAGEQTFIDLYTDDEKAADPDKADTGLFLFRGDDGARTAIWSAGGGFMYVGAMHDSFPHAIELSRRGYNALAIIYRPGAQTACEDLARAIALAHEHADEWGISMDGYLLGGGSAGARMSAWLGSYGTESFGEDVYPRPAAVIIQYTGLSEVTGTEPPTYANVGTSDSIANYRTMQDRIDAIQASGTPAQIEVFDGLQHGFGLGERTVAEGWLDRAVSFWEQQA